MHEPLQRIFEKLSYQALMCGDLRRGGRGGEGRGWVGEGVVRGGCWALVQWMGIEKENLFGKIHVIVSNGYNYMYLLSV